MYLQNAETRILGVQSSTSAMASWNTLPPEIRDHILSLFCRNIITEYKVFDKKKDVLELYKQNPVWPTPTPQALIDFSSALRVSRSFRDSILRVKTKGRDPIKTLQLAQISRCDAVMANTNRLVILPSGKFARRWGILNGAWFMKFAGIFWKNPLIREDAEYMWEILSSLRMVDLLMLIPHLEEWILEHVSRMRNSDESFDYVVRPDFIEQHRDIVFQSRSRQGPSNGYNADVVGITGLYHGWKYQAQKDLRPGDRELQPPGTKSEYAKRQDNANEELIEDCREVLEYLEENRGNWWLFSLKDGRAWVIVNYELKSMWGTMCSAQMCEWRDAWHWRTWKFRGEEKAWTSLKPETFAEGRDEGWVFPSFLGYHPSLKSRLRS